MGHILIGLLLVALGFVLTRYAHWIVENFGTMAWAEAHLGSSQTAWRLLGLLVAIVGLMVMTNLAGPLFLGLFGKVFTGLAG
jgi:hypothetical protein